MEGMNPMMDVLYGGLIITGIVAFFIGLITRSWKKGLVLFAIILALYLLHGAYVILG